MKEVIATMMIMMIWQWDDNDDGGDDNYDGGDDNDQQLEGNEYGANKDDIGRYML